MTKPPVGFMSRGFIDGRAREAAERGALALSVTEKSTKKASEVRLLKPAQEHPRECRCSRPMPTEDGCLKCGLPEVWQEAPLAERIAIAQFVEREREAEYRGRRRRMS